MTIRDKLLSLFSCLLFAVVACGDDSPKARAESGKNASSGRIQRKTYYFKEANKEMEYAQYVPTNLSPGKKTPLVLALHGLGSNPQQIMRYPGMTDLAEKHGYVVVAPMGYNSRGWYGQRIRIGARPDDPENLHELSEKDVMNVLDLARREFDVDPQRIYLMGHSMGGGGTFHLAMEHPDLFAALGPIAPAIFRPATDLEKIKHVPVILVQGEKDNLVPVTRVRTWVDKMRELNMTLEYVEVPGGDHITPAFRQLPKIFEFFDKHPKKPMAAP